MATVQEAEQMVRRLTRKYGFLNEQMMDDIEQFNAEYRREIDENWLAMESAVSHSVKILAKNIYGSGARFVFELLQNAEDNVFTKAYEAKAQPYVSFKIYPEKIVVECNEDGFKERDLQAICAVGQSTKSASHGYIGAKGIGFKSVFIAASRVHIESGNFSFEFRHNKNDPGIGMVRPLWVTPAETIPKFLTRMTLHIHDQGDMEEIEHLKRTISEQFDDLQETCLLFLRKLEKISIEFYDDNGELERSKHFRKRTMDEYRMALETASGALGDETTKSQAYHITRKIATGLPQSDNREVPDSEEGKRKASKAEVVLAFPIDDQFEPLITQRNQELFAFLPLRRSDYKFLIHADFDTNANRQDIVTTSRRNLVLREWIVQAFFQAILEFCKHTKLRYSWPMFLPSPDASSDAFWSGLNRMLKDFMTKTPVLLSRRRTDFRLIKDVVILVRDGMDAQGNPLFDDEAKDLYLSPGYQRKATDILKNYGLKVLSSGLLLNLVEADIRSPQSKLQAKESTNEWHSAAARLLSEILLKGSSGSEARLKVLPLVPLRSGSWTSTMSGPVYFPTTGGIKIPNSVELSIIDTASSENIARKTLFQHLGAREATNEEVRRSILRSFNPDSWNASKKLLDFLYLTHQTEKHDWEQYAEVRIDTGGGNRRSPRSSDIYLPKGHPVYGALKILGAQGDSPGYEVTFMKWSQYKNPPNRPGELHPTWERWLCDVVGVRERLRLVSNDGDSLSNEFLWVHENRPEKFLGLFEHLWLHEKSALMEKPTLRSTIQELSATKLCGVDHPVELAHTWLPLKPLLQLVDRYMDHPRQFPFLNLGILGTTTPIGSKWDFLHDYFSVGKDDGLTFLLDVLYFIEKSCSTPSAESQIQKVFDLYVAIWAKVTASGDDDERERVRDFFELHGVIYPGYTGEDDPTWIGLSGVGLWAAPPNMASNYSLRALYLEMVDDEKLKNIENLFKGILQVQDASLDDLLQELRTLRDEECEEIHRLRAVYDYLHKADMPLTKLKAEFEQEALIYCETRHGESGWYKTSECLWSSETVIRDTAILDECWEAYEDFFVGKLGVKLLTLQMVYDELRQPSEKSTEEIKVALLLLNGLLQTEKTRLDPEPIRQAKVFPIRYSSGTVVLSSTRVDFAIGDRDKLRTVFREKISLLDFEMEEVRRLGPLFEWLGLQDRYLSHAVEESTYISGDSQRPVSSPNRDLKCKAYHIVRVAATFNSPRFEDDPQGLYEQLRTMQVLEVERISSVLKIFQNKESFEVPIETANEHIDDSSGELTIYVPKERKAQELCFGSVLPRKLAAWLMRPSSSSTGNPIAKDAIRALTAIFASSRWVLDDILDDQGILQVSLENEDEDNGNNAEGEENQDEEQHLSENNLDAGDTSSERLTPSHSSITGGASPHSGLLRATRERSSPGTDVEVIFSQRSHMSHQPSSGRVHSSFQPDSSRGSSEPPPRASPSAQHFTEDARYRAILNRVVEKARGATFPSRGVFDMSEMRNALPGNDGNDYESFDGLDLIGQFRSSSQLERDKKVGAAGELYVFELLSQLGMPQWSRENWKSTIRSYVTIHPDYADLQDWNGRETADLVYHDVGGHLTSTLIGCGYLEHDEWHEARPKYYIEVKTTTGPCNTAFYMSGNQYRLMQRVHRSEDRSEIYIVFRVFQLNSNDIDLCIYTDPEQLRQDGRLLFRAQTWSVIPGDGEAVDD